MIKARVVNPGALRHLAISRSRHKWSILTRRQRWARYDLNRCSKQFGMLNLFCHPICNLVLMLTKLRCRTISDNFLDQIATYLNFNLISHYAIQICSGHLLVQTSSALVSFGVVLLACLQMLYSCIRQNKLNWIELNYIWYFIKSYTALSADELQANRYTTAKITTPFKSGLLRIWCVHTFWLIIKVTKLTKIIKTNNDRT